MAAAVVGPTGRVAKQLPPRPPGRILAWGAAPDVMGIGPVPAPTRTLAAPGSG